MDPPVRIIEPPHSRGIMLVPSPPPPPASHRGWMVFAGLTLLVASALNAVWGILALANDYYFTGDTLLAGYHSLWGWLYIGFAVAQFLIALLVFVRNPVGVTLGILAIFLNAVAHVFGFGGKPLWSIVAIAVDALALYGLVSYGFPPTQPWARPRTVR